MSAVGAVVRLLRPATDPMVLFSFNRMGFEVNRHGFDPDDMPRQVSRRVALVTGANSGIGRAAARELLRRGFDVWLLCRDPVRGAEARDALAREGAGERVHLGIVDMSSLRSIRGLVDQLPPDGVDVLVHNAGILTHDRQLSANGVELTFATHVLGPFALTRMLEDRLSRSSDARVIFVASGGLYFQRLDLSLLESRATFDGTRAYANAKRAQVILAHVLAERFSERAPITFASMHPGWADTNALRTSLPAFHAAMRGLLRTAEQGADTVVWLSMSHRPRGTRGAFWFDRRVAREYPLPATRESPAARERLLDMCQQLTEEWMR
jgi:dehydrogenase/reductase SDR family member 12